LWDVTLSGSVTKRHGTQYPDCEAIPCSIPACRLMLSQTLILSVNIPRQMEAASLLNTILPVDFQFWKISRAKCAVNLFVLGYYMLHRLISLQWVHRILCTVDCGRLTVMHLVLLPVFIFKQKLLELHNFRDWSFMVFFAFTNATSFTGKLMALVDGYFCWHFPTKLHKRSPLHC